MPKATLIEEIPIADAHELHYAILPDGKYTRYFSDLDALAVRLCNYGDAAVGSKIACIFNGEAEYLVFTDCLDFKEWLDGGVPAEESVSAETSVCRHCGHSPLGHFAGTCHANDCHGCPGYEPYLPREQTPAFQDAFADAMNRIAALRSMIHAS